MKEVEILVVRIYLHEAEAQMQKLLAYLHDDCKVRGVTVFRGITGFGQSGEYHSSSLIDMSLDLPVIIEFFDTPEVVTPILEHMNTLVEPGHMIYWSARTNEA